MRSVRLVNVATGKEEADMVIKNCRIVNVYTSLIDEGDIAIADGVIAGIGSYNACNSIDANGRFVCPGFIDGHSHIESSLMTPSRFAQAVLPLGTTTVIADPHEIANVAGIAGLRYMIDDSLLSALDVFFMLPSCVPATSFEHSGAVLCAKDLSGWLHHRQVIGLGEMMDYPGVIGCDANVHEKLSAARGRIVDGHAPGLSGAELNAYISAGITSDHECSSIDEMNEKIGKGMFILIREGSAAKNLVSLIKGVHRDNFHRTGFCTDDKHPDDIMSSGHIDHNVRLAIATGIDPVMAIQMATFNTASFYRLYDRGAVAPGMKADLLIIDNLENIGVEMVIKDGQVAAADKTAIFEFCAADSKPLSRSINICDSQRISFDIRLKGNLVHVIKLQPNDIVTLDRLRSVNVVKGRFSFDKESDIIKLAVIERHKSTGNVGLGLLEGYGLKNGAIAMSISHDSHNIVIAGDNDDDMRLSLKTLEDAGGGIVLVSNGRVSNMLPLEIGGIMTDRPAEEVSAVLKSLIAEARLHGVPEGIDPFLSLAFMALPVIPQLKLTDQGLFDVTNFKFINIEPDEHVHL